MSLLDSINHATVHRHAEHATKTSFLDDTYPKNVLSGFFSSKVLLGGPRCNKKVKRLVWFWCSVTVYTVVYVLQKTTWTGSICFGTLNKALASFLVLIQMYILGCIRFLRRCLCSGTCKTQSSSLEACIPNAIMPTTA